MSKKIYIAGRVSGLKYDTVRKNFASAEKHWKELGFEVVNPIKLCKKDWSRLRCMFVCIRNLWSCDYAYFMPNYKKSRGARIELWFAKKLNKIVYLSKTNFC